MANTESMKMENEQELKEGSSEDSIKSKPLENLENKGSMNSSPSTTADIRKGSTKTWTSAALAELKLKIGLLTGALADFQSAGGLVAVKPIEHSKGSFSVRLYLVVDGLNIIPKETNDGLDFEILPLGSGIVVDNLVVEKK
jgi:hypothetical protein